MGFLRRNMPKKMFLVLAISIVTITLFLHNRDVDINGLLLTLRSAYSRTDINSAKEAELPKRTSVDGIHHYGNIPDYDHTIVKENVHVFRLGSNLLKSGAVDGPDSKRKMKSEKNEVPIVFVDEHHEVIPYWYKAVEEGLISKKKNTLIHIDGHSDFAPPQDPLLLQRFIQDSKQKKQKNSLLPLMQGNDEFIVSAAMTGLINRIIWIKPDWDMPNRTAFARRVYVGTVEKDGETFSCSCVKRVSRKQPKQKYECSYRDDKDLPTKSCNRVTKNFKYFVFSASLFQKYFNSSVIRDGSFFIDIDEDYFGVESGVKVLVDSGIPLDDISTIDAILPNLYCPTSVMAERQLNRRLRNLFKKLSVHTSLDENTIKREILKETKQYICRVQETKALIAYIEGTKNRDILKALSRAKYCLFNSLKVQKTAKEVDEASGFSLCHGTIFPDDTLNQIFVDSPKGIIDRTKQLSGVLEYIFRRAKPSFFTIARSLRDGYTPRKHQTFIEKHLKNSLQKTTRKFKLKERFIYDDNLVFGEKGWKM